MSDNAATLEDLIKAGRISIDTARKEQEAWQAEDMRKRAEYDAAFREKALALLPEAVRQYAEVIIGPESAPKIRISIPGAAFLERAVGKNEYATPMEVYFIDFARRTNGWDVLQWQADDESLEILPWGCRATLEDLATALAYAVEIGDGKAEAEGKLSKMKAAQELAAQAEAKKEPARVCPLMSLGLDHDVCCYGERCAFWTGSRCAVVALAGDETSLAPFLPRKK